MGTVMGRGNDGELFGADNDALNVGWGREWAMLGLTPFSVGGRWGGAKAHKKLEKKGNNLSNVQKTKQNKAHKSGWI